MNPPPPTPAAASHPSLTRDLRTGRHHLHAHPEFGFEETATAAFVAQTLRAMGITDVVEGVGGTGVVATLRRGSSPRAIALRADMDALRIQEDSTAAYVSATPGLMHACGHDGHTAMLLGAARLLHDEGGFDGTVRLIFQPAEEWGKGAQAMLDDGLLTRFPFDEIYGLHNMPGLPAGHFQTRAGPVMSAEDNFEIILEGTGGHAARPHAGNEVLVAACAVVTHLQTIVSRRLDPTDISVVSVTELVTDGTRNTLPGLAHIRGDARSFRPEVSAAIEQHMHHVVQGTAAAYQVRAQVRYTREFVPLINDDVLSEEALAAARTVLGDAHVTRAAAPITASEDFARFLTHVPGCFGFLGNGEDSAPLHNPRYDFNDASLLLGARWHASIARRRLPLA